MKIAILGAAPNSRLKAPFNDPSWTIWSCSEKNRDLPRVDVAFELHDIGRLHAGVNPLGQPFDYGPYLKWLKKLPKVYLQAADARFPNAEAYPKGEMVKAFGPYFFTSTLAWMMALAVHEKPEAIGLWGVDMSAVEEFSNQRPGCQYFIQKAVDAGIPVMAAQECTVVVPPAFYGYRECNAMWTSLVARKLELEERINALTKQQTNAEFEEHVLRGALESTHHLMNTWAGTQNGND